MTDDYRKEMDAEANAFAMALLMPEPLVRSAVEKYGFDLIDHKSVESMAKRFQVSPGIMTLRIAQLYHSELASKGLA